METGPAAAMDMSEERAKRWLAEAEGYLQLGLLDLALEHIRVVEQSSRMPYECEALTGSILRERDSFADAIPHFEGALKHRPGDLLATIGLGWCQKRIGRVDLRSEEHTSELQSQR